MNNRSSRSHTIFSFKVEVRGTGHNSLSTMQVVDLAGRENEQTSECKDERFRELRFINRSLFELANCISALCDGNREHVPFRNSKLTMLLSDSLSSNSRTTLLATLTPSPTGFDENMLTCRFLESAGRVTTQPVANRFAAAEVARRLQDEIASLKPMVVEPNTPLADELTLRETLLRQFSLVWAEDGQDHEAGSKWRGMEKCQGLEHTNHSASSALKQVGAKLSTLQRAIQAKGGVIHEAVSPATTARSEHSDGGHALRGPSGRGNAGRRLSEEKAGLAARTGAPPVASFYRVFVTVV
eukprot:g66.t1